MKIYEEQYDKGLTRLLGNEFISKSSLIFETLGTLDELNSILGVARSKIKDKSINKILKEIQGKIFTLGTNIAGSNHTISNLDILKIEQLMISLQKDLEGLKTFILPSGIESATLLHVARSLARKAERRAVALSQKRGVHINNLKYLNRLSDLLFYLARILNKKAKFKEEGWKK